MDFTKKIAELVTLGYSVGFVPCMTGIRLIVQKDGKRQIFEYSKEYPDKLTVSLLEESKKRLKEQ